VKGVGGGEREGERGRQRERERQQAPLAFRGTRRHTVGYIGKGDQEQGEIEYRSSRSGPPASGFML
jgi:hypothetical protein